MARGLQAQQLCRQWDKKPFELQHGLRPSWSCRQVPSWQGNQPCQTRFRKYATERTKRLHSSSIIFTLSSFMASERSNRVVTFRTVCCDNNKKLFSFLFLKGCRKIKSCCVLNTRQFTAMTEMVNMLTGKMLTFFSDYLEVCNNR
jgi:hypothetical protein